MRIHRHLVSEVTQALQWIFEEHKYADKVIERALKNHPKWGSRDRKFFAETVYDMVRYWRFLWFCLDRDVGFGEESLTALFSVHWFLQHEEFPGLPGHKFLDGQKILAQKKKSSENIAIVESYPDWMSERIAQELGEVEMREILKSLNQKAPIVLRVNRLKTTRESLQEKLTQEQVNVEFLKQEKYPDALVLKERKNVFVTQAFKNGLFEMQDASSQLVAPFMKLEPGLRVMDACAGAGGKTLHMASLMKNKGKIIAMDVEEWKLQELKKRTRRNGVDIAETRLIDSNKIVKRLEESFDRVLLDVPCSGLGVLRRNPDTKWKLTSEKISELQKLQKKILLEYSSMVKKNGYLIYATCSLLPSENRTQIDWFLQNSKNQWEFEEDQAQFPHKDGFDGFYMARLKRRGTS